MAKKHLRWPRKPLTRNSIRRPLGRNDRPTLDPIFDQKFRFRHNFLNKMVDIFGITLYVRVFAESEFSRDVFKISEDRKFPVFSSVS